MPWLLLALSLWCGLFVINAFRPRTRPPTLAAISFFAGWLTIEVALHHLLWQVAAFVMLVFHGALEGWPGWVGAALFGSGWAGLLVCAWRSYRTRATVESALQAGLGRSYRQRIAPKLAAKLSDRPRLTELLIPWPLRPRDVERLRDLPFREVGGRTLALDVYRSRGWVPGSPALLEVHGGGWVIGDKREQGLPLMYHLARQGWVCVTANYRLSPGATFPEPLEDLKWALRWIREEGPAYGIDPGFVIVTGQSAGAHLASLLALTAGQAKYQRGFEGVDTSVQGCVSFYGIYDLLDREGDVPHDGMRRLVEAKFLKARLRDAPELFEEASPRFRISAAAPPFLLLHGDRDSLAPVAGARRFHEALERRSGAPVCFAELVGAQHAFDIFPSLRGALAIRGVERFLAALYSDHLAAVARAAEMED
ncbi:MAG: alpha/beta hydrolase [bacterium]